MKLYKYLGCLLCLAGTLISCHTKQEPTYSTVKLENSNFTVPIRDQYLTYLDSAAFYMKKIDTLSSLKENQSFFIESRKWYKRAEPMMIAYDYQNYLSINAPNLLKVEIDDYTDIKKLKPKSYQVLEEYLFGEDTIANKELSSVYYYLQVRLPYLRTNHNLIRQYDYHHLTMLRDAIVNIATKGITGFDSPILANSLLEAKYNYETILKVIEIFEVKFANPQLFHQWKQSIELSMSRLTASNFDNFDRYDFIKSCTDPQLQLVVNTARDWDVQLQKTSAINPEATHIFSKKFFNIKTFKTPHSPAITQANVDLGRALFNDKNLSASKQISCATCHIASKAFTDGKAIAIGLKGVKLARNTPPLPYALFQKSFFYDGRAAVLEDQIVSVSNNQNEFHIAQDSLVEIVKKNPVYVAAFDNVYDGKITSYNIRNAIANYIRNLAPFDSKVDRNMQNLENTLTAEEIKGFNLFMGKAACATCHFAPTFFGTVPPKFNETEMEHLGVTATDDFNNPLLDTDPGQYFPYKVEEKRGFFKTSTVRNAALTAPYMHNGAYKTLKKVLEFYNKGGGAGMGLDVPYQTLPAAPLNLEEDEVSAIIAFINALTDSRYVQNPSL